MMALSYDGSLLLLQASLLCKATYEGKLDRLRCLLLAGCAVGATDYDGQTALHVAAADGNLPAVRPMPCRRKLNPIPRTLLQLAEAHLEQ
jgi:ankyrin repeat protein